MPTRPLPANAASHEPRAKGEHASDVSVMRTVGHGMHMFVAWRLQLFSPSGLRVAQFNQRRIVMQQHLTYMRRKAAAGWAFLVWLFGGGLGLAIVVFIVLKMMGH